MECAQNVSCRNIRYLHKELYLPVFSHGHVPLVTGGGRADACKLVSSVNSVNSLGFSIFFPLFCLCGVNAGKCFDMDGPHAGCSRVGREGARWMEEERVRQKLLRKSQRGKLAKRTFCMWFPIILSTPSHLSSIPGGLFLALFGQDSRAHSQGGDEGGGPQVGVFISPTAD